MISDDKLRRYQMIMMKEIAEDYNKGISEDYD
jgi:hypothetical protein